MASLATKTTKAEIADRLAEQRQRTLELIEPLSEDQLNHTYSPILSPVVWDLGHIANFEELWLVQRIGGLEPLRGDLGRMYDAIETPRRVRDELPLLRGADCFRYMEEVRKRALDVLDGFDLDSSDDPLLSDGFIYEMVLAHEAQHNETILQLIQMVPEYPTDLRKRSSDEALEEMVFVPGGEYEIGAGPDGFAYDNERQRHSRELPAFRMDSTPVTNGQFAEFMADTRAEPPMYWHRDGGEWMRTVMGETKPLDPGLPVIHVSFHQAEAFARWAGKRLPSEAEWEAAAASGTLQGLREVWEWTSSDFQPYPGFRAFPYREYSEPFFGDSYKVLRGGSWATRRFVARTSFRNWDLPERRQIFAGFRCARDD